MMPTNYMASPEAPAISRTIRPHPPESISQGKLAVFFQGQGSQDVGMGKAAYNAYPHVRNIWHQADEKLGYSISKICFNGSKEDIDRHVQVAILTDTHVLYQLLKEHDASYARPDFVGGLSLGELYAFVASGAVDFYDMLKVVDRRNTEFLPVVESGDSGVLQIKIKTGSDDQLTHEQKINFGTAARVLNAMGLQIGYFYKTNHIAMGGTQAQVEAGLRVMKEFQRFGVEASVSPVPAAFHTEIMSSAVPGIEEAVRELMIREADIPIVANTTGQLITTPEEISAEIIRHVDNAVKLSASVHRLRRNGVTNFAEVGTRPIVTVLTKAPHEERKAIRTSEGITLGFSLTPSQASQ